MHRNREVFRLRAAAAGLGALAGQTSVDDALKQAQDVATRTMTKAGYIK